MTLAPESLRNGRRLLTDNLDLHEGTNRYPGDLDPEEVGIVPDLFHRGGYHCGRDRVNPAKDYSVIESVRDRNGLTLHSSALDIGWFELRVHGKTHNLRSFSIWLVAQCKANTADTADIREIIYSPDGRIVKRWDRLRRRSTGDRSHLTHTHLSFFRDAIKAGRDVCVPVFRRYLTEIGLLAQAKEDDDMAVGDDIYRLLEEGLRPPGTAQTSGGGVPVAWIVRKIAEIQAGQVEQQQRDEAILAAVRDNTLLVPGDPQATADRLRQLLGDQAAAVGRLLAAVGRLLAA